MATPNTLPGLTEPLAPAERGAPAATDMPVAAGERYDALDLLRGIAVLMIFTVNIRAMVQPFFALSDPGVWDGPHDLMLDRVLQYAVDGKWVAMFSILFGAGLMLLHDKARAAGTAPNDRIVRRQTWLIGFGVIHASLIWLGDILVSYGVVGLLVMPLLGRRSRTVMIWGACVFGVGLALMWGLGALTAFVEAEGLLDESMMMTSFIEAEVAAKSGGIGSQLAWRATQLPIVLGNIFVAPLFLLPYMVVGVLAYRSGFLLAQWPLHRYLAVSIICLGGAWAIDWWRIGAMGVWDAGAGEAGASYQTLIQVYYWASLIEGLAGGVGYAGLVMMAVRLGLRVPAMSAVGRMAFTNYIACSLIGTTIAAGHGGGLLGALTLAQALMIVGAVWTAMLVWSPLWLRAFRYGPLEWLWRSLSYGVMQPMR